MNSKPKGSLICVGTGIKLGAHITPIARKTIEKADTVFMSVSSHLMEEWVSQMASDVRNLQSHYQKGVSRNQTYRSMIKVITDEVRLGKNVCLVLYGHPGVFALVAHKSMNILRDESYLVKMEPGISAEDCLVADLGIDPGKFGCQQYETTQFMMYKRVIDTSAYLILWQIGVAGDISFAQQQSNHRALSILLEILSKYYPLTHEVIVYEASTLPVNSTRIEKVSLKDIVSTHYHDYSTLVIPPSTEMQKNIEVQKKLRAIAN